MNKKLYQIIREEQVVAVLLAATEDECKDYLVENNIIDDIQYVKIIEVAKQEKEDEKNVIPLMIAKKFTWYDLRHYRHLYIYEG